jgi:tRNA(Ile)-lysidine synthetase-like protein
MALLAALVQQGKHPIVAHVDHGWRQDSREDAALVRAAASQQGLACRTSRLPADMARTESAAREARWKCFKRWARKEGVRDIVLAHHADDQVETFLLQLLRGSGSGLHGMRRISERDGLTVHRPWLGIWRPEIEAFARAHGVIWREDSTNKEDAFLRNRVRRRLVPYLTRLAGRDIRQAIWRAATIMGDEHAWLDSLATQNVLIADAMDAKSLAGLPPAQARRVIRLWLAHHRVADVSFDDVEAVRGLASSDRSPARVNLAGGCWARRTAGKLWLQVNPRL